MQHCLFVLFIEHAFRCQEHKSGILLTMSVARSVPLSNGDYI